MDSATLAHALDRLSRTGRVLYVAAHPDDENTRLLAYLANGLHLGATYLSMTRGGGGQNLIGAEQAELLDVIRTEELLAARRLDGATQRFTRMRDFGYSKTARETLALWGHDQALADVVWVIRTLQPDVIITRFDESPPNHGHHTASAILAREAFAAAADPQKFPEQLTGGVTVWRADRLLNNVPQWREGPPPPGAVSIDVGAYDPRLGLGYGELAALSRSQHKSQGFGVPGERGPLIERFVSVAGRPITKDPLEGLDLGWTRYGPPAKALITALDQARAALHPDRPEQILPPLLAAHRALAALPDEPRTRDARRELDRLIAGASGLFVRATAPQPSGVPGATVKLKVELVMRRAGGVRLERLRFPDGVAEVSAPLALDEKKEVTRDVILGKDARISAPYWLAEPADGARQVVRDQALVGQPEGPPPLAVTAELKLDDRLVRVEVPVLYGWTDRVHGERLRHFLVVPPATVTPTRDAIMFPNGKAAPLSLVVRAGQDALDATVTLPLPAGWRATPPTQPVKLAKAGDETTVRFEITPPKGATEAILSPAIEAGGVSWSYRQDVIDYPHIPMQVVLQPARVRLSPLALKLPAGRVGYVPGSGDTIAADLAHVGLGVDIVDDEQLRGGDLSRYAAIILGIRAYNTRPLLRSVQPRLMKYVEGGGTLIMQYNTNSRWDVLDQPLGPFPLEIGRDRVTDERAEMVPVDPRSPVLTTPNLLGPADYAGWVQERGLYFAAKYDPKYQPIFRIADPDEPPLLGGLLVAKHGKGRHIYTGLAFFRQLPAGVPGGYRLLINLIGAR